MFEQWISSCSTTDFQIHCGSGCPLRVIQHQIRDNGCKFPGVEKKKSRELLCCRGWTRHSVNKSWFSHYDCAEVFFFFVCVKLGGNSQWHMGWQHKYNQEDRPKQTRGQELKCSHPNTRIYKNWFEMTWRWKTLANSNLCPHWVCHQTV